VVVFHFSGHGSRVVDPDQDFPDGLNSTLVPVDSRLPEGFPRQGGPVEDITGHTLFLLGSALQTDNVTFVLDSCHSGGGTRGNLVVRARRGGPSLEMSPDELAYQDQWLSRLNLSPAGFIKQRREGIARGVAIASARRDQYAADAPFEDFYAGAFSYVMTQYLWQQTGMTPFSSTIPNIARTTTQLSFSGQEPQLEVQPDSSHGSQPMYFTDKTTPPAEAVVTKVEGNSAEIWLGGIDPRSLEAFQTDAILSAVDDDGASRGLLQIISRQGLTGRGRLLQATMPTGSLLQEQIRGVPTDVSLRIGLDTSLTGTEQTQARQGITAIPRMEAMALQQGEVHYILGRMTAAYRTELAGQPGRPPGEIPAEGCLGLFAPGLDLIPGSFGSPEESVDGAMERLRPKLRSLLAARLVKLTLNPGSSRLAVEVMMRLLNVRADNIVGSAFTVRSANSSTNVIGATAPARSSSGSLQIPLGTSIQFEIQNKEGRNLYLSLLVIDATGEIAVLFPNQWAAAVDATLIRAGQTIQVPENSDSFRLITIEPKGPTEALFIVSSQPLNNALQALQRIATRSGTTSGPVAVADPTEVVDGLLSDISSTSRGSSSRGSGSTRGNASVQAVDVSQLAALSITFDVVDADH
jgi:hypothetical protein